MDRHLNKVHCKKPKDLGLFLNDYYKLRDAQSVKGENVYCSDCKSVSKAFLLTKEWSEYGDTEDRTKIAVGISKYRNIQSQKSSCSRRFSRLGEATVDKQARLSRRSFGTDGWCEKRLLMRSEENLHSQKSDSIKFFRWIYIEKTYQTRKRILNSLMVPKNEKGGPLRFFTFRSVANQKIEREPFGDNKVLKKT